MTPSKRIKEAGRSQRERSARQDEDLRTLAESLIEHGGVIPREVFLTGLDKRAIEEELERMRNGKK